MKLPHNFEWLNTVGVLPKMVQEGIKILGTREIPGPTSNPVILEMASELRVRDIYKNDDTSWCAVSHNAVAYRAGKAIFGQHDKWDLLRAIAFLQNGVTINKDNWEVVKTGDAILGDSLIFSRPGGGHIGLYIGETASHYIVMGGNQNNEYSFTRVAKNRLVGIRRPVYKTGRPASAKKYELSADGVPVTSNES